MFVMAFSITFTFILTVLSKGRDWFICDASCYIEMINHSIFGDKISRHDVVVSFYAHNFPFFIGLFFSVSDVTLDGGLERMFIKCTVANYPGKLLEAS